MFIGIILVTLSLLAGCGGKKSKETTDLKTYPNKINLQVDKPMTGGIVTGTIVGSETEKEPSRSFVKIKVEKFELLSAATSPNRGVELPAGMEIVIEVRNPKVEFPENKKITASLRISRMAGGGYKLIAENARVL